MTTEEFIELNKDLGHKIINCNNYSWLVRDNGSAISLPTLTNIFPKKRDLELMLKKSKVLTFKTKISTTNSSEFLFRGDSYEISDFKSKIRNQIRKGLSSCDVREAKIEELISKGLIINQRTLSKHKRGVVYLQEKLYWEKYIKTMRKNPDITILGAYVEEELVAYVVFIKVEDRYYIYHPFMDFKFSSSNPMNAILYTFINDIISKEGYIDISYGLASYIDKKGLDHFKKGMLFVEEPTTRITVLSFFYNLSINSLSIIFIRTLHRLRLVNSNFVDKVQYFYSEKKIYKTYLREITNVSTEI